MQSSGAFSFRLVVGHLKANGQHPYGRHRDDPAYEDAEMAKQEFQIGDIVKLKSGGPDMTVQEYEGAYERYTCQWFAGKKLERGFFKEASLERKVDGAS